MKYLIAIAALLAVRVHSQSSSCSSGESTSGKAVQGISFNHVGSTGTYNQVTNMDSSTGQCSNTPYQYSGSLAPFNEELSVHIRGPIQLKSFAVYTPGSSTGSGKKSPGSSPSSGKKPTPSTQTQGHGHHTKHHHGHGHGHQGHPHRRQADLQPVVATITATIDGQVVSWTTTFGDETPTSAASPVALSDNSGNPTTAQASMQSSAAATSAPTSAAQTLIADQEDFAESGSSWSRTAYYSADAGSSNGLVFLNHLGGQGSGVFDDTFGNSLSYATSNGVNGSETAQTLANTVLPSNAEVVIMTDQSCGANGGSCGYYRPGTVAYHGFNGAHKIFLFEFSMPNSNSGDSAGVNEDMPAIWFLNANIPRTIQYPTGNQLGCSCDNSGCGEYDAFEILESSCSAGTSTIHGNKAGGAANYFARPQSGFTTFAVVMTGNGFHTLVNPGVGFADSLDFSQVNNMVLQSTSAGNKDASDYSLSDTGSG